MNDIEHDLRELFEERAKEVTTAPRAPEAIVMRSRRRELRTAAFAIVLTVAVVSLSVVGLRGVLAGRNSTPAGAVEPTRTVTVNGVTVTVPESWWVVDPASAGVEPQHGSRVSPSLIMLMSQTDLTTSGVLGCPGLNDGSLGQVLLTIQETDLALNGEAARPWPVELQPLRTTAGSAADAGCYPGWTFERAAWTAQGRSFEARVGMAPDVSDADRAALIAAYASMQFSTESALSSKGYVIGTGTAPGGGSWSLSVSKDGGNDCFTIQSDSTGLGACSTGAAPTDLPDVNVYGSGTGGPFAVGTVPAVVYAVTLQTPTVVIGDVRLLPAPPGFGPVKYVVVPLSGAGSGTLRFQDSGGNDLYPSERINWSRQSEPPPTVPALTTIGTGQALGGTWTLKASVGSRGYCTELDFSNSGSSGCTSPPPNGASTVPNPGRPEQLYFQREGSAGSLYVATIPTSVVTMEVVTDAGVILPADCFDPSAGTGTSAFGPVRFCVVGLAGNGTGTLRFLAADGSEVFSSQPLDWSNQQSP